MTTTPIFDELMQTPRWAKLFPKQPVVAKAVPASANLPKRRRKATTITPKAGTV